MKSKSMVCFYHANCFDGFGALLAVKLHCERNNVKLKAIPVDYSDAPEKTEQDINEVDLLDDVVIVDYCFDVNQKDLDDENASATLPITNYILERTTGNVTVIDHHPYHVKVHYALQGLALRNRRFRVVHDDIMSGAKLTWLELIGKVPALIENVSDRDLWRFELPESRSLGYSLGAIMGNEAAWWKAINEKSYYDELVRMGVVLQDQMRSLVYNAIEFSGKIVTVENYMAKALEKGEYVDREPTVLFFNGSRPMACEGSDMVHRNDIVLGNGIEVDLVGCYFILPDGRVKMSFRGHADKDFSAQTMANVFGGGGHRDAAGCTMGFYQLMNILNN